MDGLVSQAPMLDAIRGRGFFEGNPFVLIDVGCSGGIPQTWRLFGRSLVVHGYDPNIDSCEQLQAQEAFPHVRYHPRFVGLPQSHPFVQQRLAEAARWPRTNPWGRNSIVQTVSKPQLAMAEPTSPATRWADPATVIRVAEIVAQERLATVDFLKVDVDGPDLDVLESANEVFASQQVLGVGIEVNWFGTANPLEHTFHNTDRFLRQHGFSLFSVSQRRYSRAALPGPFQYEYWPQTRFGQPYQGDAVYLRDLAAPHQHETAEQYPDEKLLKLACLYELFGLPDCAAEVLGHFASRLERFGEVEPLLDALTPPLLGQKLTYRQYLEKFEKEPHLFLPSAQAAWEARQRAVPRVVGRLVRRVGRRIRRMLSSAAGVFLSA